MEPTLKKFPQRHALGLQAKFITAASPKTDGYTIIPELWKKYYSRRSEISAPSSAPSLGITTPTGVDDERFYLASTQVTGTEKTPEGMVAMNIPAGNYAVFTHKGPAENISQTMGYVYGVWLSKNMDKVRAAPHVEIYDGRFKPETGNAEFDICVPVKD